MGKQTVQQQYKRKHSTKPGVDSTQKNQPQLRGIIKKSHKEPELKFIKQPDPTKSLEGSKVRFDLPHPNHKDQREEFEHLGDLDKIPAYHHMLQGRHQMRLKADQLNSAILRRRGQRPTDEGLEGQDASNSVTKESKNQLALGNYTAKGRPRHSKDKEKNKEGEEYVKYFTNPEDIFKQSRVSIDQIIPLLSEGTQTHPEPILEEELPSPPSPPPPPPPPPPVTEAKESEDLTPYWQVELNKGKDHLAQHREEYFRAHEVIVQNALNPSIDGSDDESARSRATIYPGTLADGLPPGLIFLNGIDRIFLVHRVQVVDGIVVCLNKTKNHYELINGSGHKIFRIEEDRVRKCWGLGRGYQVTLFDDQDRQVIRMRKKIRLHRNRRAFDVFSPVETFVGSVVQKWNFSRPEFALKDVDGTEIIVIEYEGTLLCGFGRTNTMAFRMKTTRGSPRGRVAADWPDLKRALFSTQDSFGALFPSDLSVLCKVLVVCGSFVVYHHYFDGILEKNVHHHIGSAARALVDFEIQPSRTPTTSTIV